MTAWARTSRGPLPLGDWHYFPRGIDPATFYGPKRAACEEVIDADCCEGRGDAPDREVPDPACRTCWLARQAVEAYRRSLTPDPGAAEVDQALRAATQSLVESASNRVRWYTKGRARSAKAPAHALDALVLAMTLCELAQGKPPSQPGGLEMVRRITGACR